jgi:hypothetical protein
MTRPIDQSDVIPRKDVISIIKFKVESRLEEEKLVLGWIIDTRSLSLALPIEKYGTSYQSSNQKRSIQKLWNH